MRFALRDHQAKSVPFAEALIAAGNEPVSHTEPHDLLLTDLDLDLPAYRPFLDNAEDFGAKVLLYQHGATAPHLWDGMFEPNPNVSGMAVVAPGYAEVLRRYGYPHNVAVVGFPWGPVARLLSRKVWRVLFCPRHPSGSGYLHPAFKEENAKAFELLRSEDYDLTVRHIGTLEQNGITEESDVRYIQGRMDNSLTGLEDADVVVADGTFASLAISYGVPTVVWNADEAWKYDEIPQTRPEHWDDYADLIANPVPLKPGAVKRVGENPSLLDEWRENFIGQPFDPGWFAAWAKSITLERERV